MMSLKKYFFLILFFALSFSLPAQIHLKGLAGLEVQAGAMGPASNGYALLAGYSKYITSASYYKASMDIDYKSYRIESASAFTMRYLANLVYYRTFVKDRVGNFYLNASFGGFVGYENVNGESRLLKSGLQIQPESKTVYGLSGGLEAEYYVKDHLALLLSFKERWFINSDTKHFRPYLTLGIKQILR